MIQIKLRYEWIQLMKVINLLNTCTEVIQLCDYPLFNGLRSARLSDSAGTVHHPFADLIGMEILSREAGECTARVSFSPAFA